MVKTEVPITGSVLTWAMSEAGYTEEQLAGRLGVSSDVVRDWQAERARPGKTEFRRILDAVRRPSAIFFMPQPPLQAGLPTRFRSAPGLRDHRLSPEALREIRKARRLQQAIAWLLRSAEAAQPVQLPRFDWEREDPARAGAAVRRSIGVSLAYQALWSNFSEAFRKWRDVFDAAGLLVFSLQLGKDEIRGFSAWDDDAPLIAVNTAFSEGARIFTVAHELGHLVSRTDSACYDWVAPGRVSDPKLERWCEKFAAAFLLPPDELKGYLAYQFSIDAAHPVRDFDLVWKLSRRLKVSARAMAIALIDADLAPSELYGLVEEQAPKVDRPPDRAGGGGQPVVQKRLNQYGVRAPRTLIAAVSDGALGVRDAADYLDVNMGDLQDLDDALHGRAAVKR